MLLGRCEFGRDDYSLNIVNMPTSPGLDFDDYKENQDSFEKKNRVQELRNKFTQSKDLRLFD